MTTSGLVRAIPGGAVHGAPGYLSRDITIRAGIPVLALLPPTGYVGPQPAKNGMFQDAPPAGQGGYMAICNLANMGVLHGEA